MHPRQRAAAPRPCSYNVKAPRRRVEPQEAHAYGKSSCWLGNQGAMASLTALFALQTAIGRPTSETSLKCLTVSGGAPS
eukprot:scaffold37729_cov65-Phaeocystis_antarctica.AAC.4